MELFKYLEKGQDLSDALEIYDMVYSSRIISRAKKEYHGKVDTQDALDDVFHHVYTRYKSHIGRVENFTNRTMSTIDKSKYENEVANSEAIERKMDKAQYGERNLVGELPTTRRSKYEMIVDKVEKSTDAMDCMDEIEESFVENLEYFVTGGQKITKGMPDSLLVEYELDTIQQAIQLLYQKHKEEIESFISLKQDANMRAVNPACLNLPFDNTIDVLNTLDRITIVSRKQGYHAKNLYSLDVNKFVQTVWKTFYETGKARIKGKKNYYLTLSGLVLKGDKEIKDYLEAELITALTSTLRLKVVRYVKGKQIIYSSTKTAIPNSKITIFGKQLKLNFQRQTVKEVLLETSPFDRKGV